MGLSWPGDQLKNSQAWRLVAVPLVVLASLALGIALGGLFCHLTATGPSDVHDVDYANLCALTGLPVGLLIGLAWSFVILTNCRDGEQ